MKAFVVWSCTVLVIAAAAPAYGNAYREQGKLVEVGDAGLTVTPPRDWNRLSAKPGKFTETWTLDGELLNDLTFYVGVPPGQPLVKERNKKREPLPKFGKDTLIAEIPELLERTYRAHKKIGAFTLTTAAPERFLGQEGIRFAYDYLDQDELPRKGEARAALIGKKLFMVTFDAPRLSYFERTAPDFRALIETAKLTP